MYPELLETTIQFFNQIHWAIGPSKNEKFSFEDRAQASRPPAVQARGRRAYSSNCMVVAKESFACTRGDKVSIFLDSEAASALFAQPLVLTVKMHFWCLPTCAAICSRRGPRHMTIDCPVVEQPSLPTSNHILPLLLSLSFGVSRRNALPEQRALAVAQQQAIR